MIGNRLRRRHSLRAALAGLALLATPSAARTDDLLTGILASQPDESGETTTIETFTAWRVTCETTNAAESCRMSATASARDGSRSVAVEMSANRPATGNPVFVLLTPLDLLVANGLEMRVDGGNPMRLAYRSCHAQGCVAPFALDRTMRGLFTRGARLDLRLFDVQNEPIDLHISLMGFSAAIKAMEAH